MINSNPFSQHQPIQLQPQDQTQHNLYNSVNFNKISLSIPAFTNIPRIASG